MNIISQSKILSLALFLIPAIAFSIIPQASFAGDNDDAIIPLEVRKAEALRLEAEANAHAEYEAAKSDVDPVRDPFQLPREARMRKDIVNQLNSITPAAGK